MAQTTGYWRVSPPLPAIPILRILAVALGLLAAGPPAEAVDSQRTLTQALLRKWQIQQGLPHPTITVVYQSSDGALWLGTEAGLYQFDGVRFDPVTVTDGESLSSLWITDLAEDRNGTLWIASRKDGVWSIHDGEVLKYQLPISDGLSRVNCLEVDSEGRVWAGGNGGAACFTSGTFKRYTEADGLGMAEVLTIASGPDGTLWFGGESRFLFAFRDGMFTRDSRAFPQPVRQILWAANGKLWVGAGNALFRSEAATEKPVAVHSDVVSDAVECLVQAQDHSVWVGTRGGLYRVVGKEIEFFGVREGLTQSKVLTIFEDQEQTVWVGTRNGLNQFVDRVTFPVTTAEGLPSNNAGPSAETPSGDFWVATLDAGLARFNGKLFQSERALNAKLGKGRVQTMIAGRDGSLWLGTRNGLFQVKDRKLIAKWEKTAGMPANSVTCLLEDDQGLLWVGTSGGLRTFDGTTFAAPGRQEGVKSRAVHCLCRGNSGRIYAATQAGVYIFENGRESYKIDGDEASLKNVHTMVEGPDRELWMAVRGRGLLYSRGDQFYTLTTEDGLYDDEISGITVDASHDLWIGCSRGIFSIFRQHALDYCGLKEAGETPPPLEYWSLSPMDAQRIVEVQRMVQPAVRNSTDGRIWFSTIHGLLAIDPRNRTPDLPSPRAGVTQLLVNGELAPAHRPLTLPPGVGNLTFRYSSRSYTVPTWAKFRYRLVGYDSDWIEAGSRREAYYTNLPPGHYEFLLSVRHQEKPWFDSSQKVFLTISPFLWQRREFQVSVALAIAGMVWLALRLRVLQVRARLNAILAERARIARELHDTLIQGFSGVTMQMQALLTRVRDRDIQDSIRDVIGDAGACLREARQSVAGLRNSVGSSRGLPEAIAETARQLTETRDVRLSLHLPDATPPMPVETEFQILRIAQEAITNATRHANARTIDVALTVHSGRMSLRIRDDGSGFSVAERERANHRHYGLIGMRERSRQIAADITIESRPGAGTTVLVDLPVGKDEAKSNVSASAAAALPLMRKS